LVILVGAAERAAARATEIAALDDSNRQFGLPAGQNRSCRKAGINTVWYGCAPNRHVAMFPPVWNNSGTCCSSATFVLQKNEYINIPPRRREALIEQFEINEQLCSLTFSTLNRRTRRTSI
jgi:hypothetical protein